MCKLVKSGALARVVLLLAPLDRLVRFPYVCCALCDPCAPVSFDHVRSEIFGGFWLGKVGVRHGNAQEVALIIQSNFLRRNVFFERHAEPDPF